MTPPSILPVALAGAASLALGVASEARAWQPFRQFPAPTHAVASQEVATVETKPEPIDLESTVRSLGAASLHERMEASVKLSAAQPGVDALFEFLKRDTLSAEQRERLTRIAWERFASTPRAALGISFQRGFVGGMESGAVIEGTFEGFDSYRVLKPGDTIYAMDDVRIHSMDEGKRVIQSREPGERVSLRIFRQGKPIIVRLALGSLPDLDRKDNVANPRAVEPAVLRDAFRLKIERALATSNVAKPLDLQPHWEGVKVHTNEQARDEATKLAAEDIETSSSVTAGGRQLAVGEAQLERFTSNPGAVESKMATLLRDLRAIDNRLQVLELQIDDPNMGAERRAQAEKSRRILQERRAQVKAAMSALLPVRGGLQP